MKLLQNYAMSIVLFCLTFIYLFVIIQCDFEMIRFCITYLFCSVIQSICCTRLPHSASEVSWMDKMVCNTVTSQRARRHMSTEIWVNMGSSNGLLPGGTKPLPEPMLTYHQWGPKTFTWKKFHERCPNHQSLEWTWKPLNWNQGSMS